MTTAEQLAVAVLRGDLPAARALVDVLLESWQGDAREVVPVRRVTVPRDRLRVVVSTQNPDVTIDVDMTRDAVARWLDTGNPLCLAGCTIDLYELPECWQRIEDSMPERARREWEEHQRNQAEHDRVDRAMASWMEHQQRMANISKQHPETDLGENG